MKHKTYIAIISSQFWLCCKHNTFMLWCKLLRELYILWSHRVINCFINNNLCAVDGSDAESRYNTGILTGHHHGISDSGNWFCRCLLSSWKEAGSLGLKQKSLKGGVSPVWATVIILNIGTDRSEQTVQTQIRLLLMEQSDQGLLCLLFCLHLLNTILHCKICLFQLWDNYGNYFRCPNF